MAIYLQVSVASVTLMLDALHVHEVLSLDAVLAGSGEHVQWRDDVISAVNLAALFGQVDDQVAMGVVYTASDNARPVMLKVDEVLGLKDLRPNDWQHLPRIPASSARFFDLVWLEDAPQRQSFRLRHPLDSQLLGVHAPAQSD